MSDQHAHGIVLLVNPSGETSLNVHWLTREHGRIITKASGARKPKSPFAGRLDLFYQANFSFGAKSGNVVKFLREVAVENNPTFLREDLQKLRAAVYASKLLLQTTELDHPVPEIYHLLQQYLGALQHWDAHLSIALVWETKYLELSGFGPDTRNLPAGAGKILDLMRGQTFEFLQKVHPSSAQIQQLSRVLARHLENAFEHIPPHRQAALGPEISGRITPA